MNSTTISFPPFNTTSTLTQDDDSTYYEYVRFLRGRLSFWANVIVIPMIGWLGMFANVLGAILIKSLGLHKSSNCLIFALAIADFGGSTTHTLNVPTMIAYVNSKVYGWGYVYYGSYTGTYLCFLLEAFFFWFIRKFSLGMSTYITLLIAVERMLAVFLPLKFSSIAIPKRVWIAILLGALVTLPLRVYERLNVVFYYWERGASSAGHYTMKFDIIAYQTYYDLLFITTFFYDTIPLGLVLVSTVCIAIKISLARQKRKEMVNNKQKQKGSSGQTTKILLAVCVVFLLYKGFQLVWRIFEWTLEDTNVVYYVFKYVGRIIEKFNHSANFVIYIALNQRFRDAFLKMDKGKIIQYSVIMVSIIAFKFIITHLLYILTSRYRF